jgi:hypothetical protein
MRSKQDAVAVAEGGAPVGVVTARGLLRAVGDKDEAEAAAA